MVQKLVRNNALLVFLAFSMAVLSAGCGSTGGASPTPTPLPALVNYEKAVFSVERGSIVSSKDVLADIVPSKQDDLFFRAGGYVNRISVKEGDLVKKGDLLAEQQIDDLLNQLQQVQIELESSQAALAKQKSQQELAVRRAETDLLIWQKRLQLAYLAAGTSQVDQLNLDITEANVRLAEIGLEQARQDVDPYLAQTVQRNQLNVERIQALVLERQIVAPYDCVVLKTRVRPGQQVEAFTALITVGDPADLVIRTAMDTELSSKLSKQSEVYLYLTSERTDGHLVQYLQNFMLVSSTESSDAISFTADNLFFSLPKDLPRDEVPLGSSVFLTVILGKKDNVLLLPPAALRQYRGLNFVIVMEGEKRRRVEINEVGLKTVDRWEVSGDLKEGDKVLGP